MSEGPVALERLIRCIKDRMQQARQACPFFQLEQRAVETPAPRSLEPGLLLGHAVLPEICPAGLGGAALSTPLEQQIALCQHYPAWIVNVENSFYASSPDLLAQLRRRFPERYLIARDLIVDEYQILQARTAGANALVLSNALLGLRRTQLYVGKLRFWEMEPVLEIHSIDEIRLALELSIRLVSLAPLPGYSQQWMPADLLEACRQLKDSRSLIYAGFEPDILEQLGSRVSAVAPGWRLWQQANPAARLKELEAAVNN